MNIIVKKDKNFTYKFKEHNSLCRKRAESLFYKESGTIKWIESFHHTDVFYDIGASIGIYSIFAAPRVEYVYAFEPHENSFFALDDNIELNRWDNIEPYNHPLYHTSGYYNFRYNHENAGKGNNQLNSNVNDTGDKFTAAKTEKVFALSLDDFVMNKMGTKIVDPVLFPTQIKIDVDGKEYDILKGAKKILESGKVKSLIVEYNPRFGADIEQFMLDLGYKLEERQFTTNGKKLLGQGNKAKNIAHNELYIKI